MDCWYLAMCPSGLLMRCMWVGKVGAAGYEDKLGLVAQVHSRVAGMVPPAAPVWWIDLTMEGTMHDAQCTMRALAYGPAYESPWRYLLSSSPHLSLYICATGLGLAVPDLPPPPSPATYDCIPRANTIFPLLQSHCQDVTQPEAQQRSGRVHDFLLFAPHCIGTPGQRFANRSHSFELFLLQDGEKKITETPFPRE